MFENIAIIGAAGKMGSWFAQYFIGQQRSVCVYDIKKEAEYPKDTQVADNISDCVRNADLVIICVSVNATGRVILECQKLMKPGAVIAEISSVKHKVFPILEDIRQDILPLCIHPMFGPGANQKKQTKILLIPVRDPEGEQKMLNQIFMNPLIKLLPDAITHDKAIGILLGLTYFVNITFAGIISKADMPLLKDLSGTTFSVQALLAESILTDEPALIMTLIKENPFARKYIRNYLRTGTAIEKLLSFHNNSTRLESVLKKMVTDLEKHQDLIQSYKRLYQMIDNQKK
jgi:prephenate dehydrogenase